MSCHEPYFFNLNGLILLVMGWGTNVPPYAGSSMEGRGGVPKSLNEKLPIQHINIKATEKNNFQRDLAKYDILKGFKDNTITTTTFATIE